MRVMFVTFSELFCQIQNLTSAIVFYENFNGFCVGMGTRNDFLKSKMHQLLMEIREDILYMNFLELHTVYVTLDRERCIDILAGYGVGARALLLVWT